MLIKINDLGPEGVRLADRVEIPRFKWDGGETVYCRESTIEGHLRPSHRGVELKASARTIATVRCARCLESFEVPVDKEFRLFIVPAMSVAGGGHEGFSAEDTDAVDIYPLAEEELDLRAVLKEQIDLFLPVHPLCNETCKGLCAGCGGNLNEGRCRCEHQVDERWGQLRDVKKLLENRKGPGPSEGR